MIDLNTLSEDERALYRAAYKRCIAILNSSTDAETVSNVISTVCQGFSHLISDEKMLQQYLEQEITCSLKYPVSTGVYANHVRNNDWWSKYKTDSSKLKYWNRYSDYLIEKKGWDSVVVENSVDASTNKVMNALADPTLQVNQDVRGLVFGHVQSGKTAHYIGLINKAIDAGYKIIIVLTGIHNNLRSQTQTRIDEEVLGFESSLKEILKKKDSELFLQIGNKIGVGDITRNAPNTDYPFQVCTSRDEKGDFTKKRSEALVANPPILAVIKKRNGSLDATYNYWNVKSPIGKKDANGKTVIGPEYPMLLIDDEADQASLNTSSAYDQHGKPKSEDASPTATNARIRKILDLFSCKSYVGYTATPYANIFIPPDAKDENNGEDLFPRDFIIKMPRPLKYFGAKEFFGWKKHKDTNVNAGVTGDEDGEEMPLYRPIHSSQYDMDTDDEVVDDIGDDLKQAIKMFFLSTAIRNCRNQRNNPNSMLIHTDRLTSEHDALFGLIGNYLSSLQNMILYNDVATLNELKDIWETDFIPTSEEMRKEYPNRVSAYPELSWEEIEKELHLLSRDGDDKIVRKVINGNSSDFLDYKTHIENNKPYNVIILGGDKLSRGLTLEGLTVSYFIRSANQYDTLMQMGRWFGYRPGYLDLCRLFVTPEIYDKFRHVSNVTEDMVNLIDYMNDIGATPNEFGFYVATHPTMLISSRNKIKSGKNLQLSFSNTYTQTTRIDVNAVRYKENFAAVETLLNVLGTPLTSDEYSNELGDRKHGNHLFWRHVSGTHIANFFRKYRASTRIYKANSENIAKYIDDQLIFGGLTDWTVCLINVGEKSDLNIGPVTGLGRGVVRNRKHGSVIDGVYSLKTLTSLDHEYLDYTAEQMVEMESIRERKRQEGSKRISSEYLRAEVRPRTQGLLILYPLDPEKNPCLQIPDAEYPTPFAVAVVFPHNGGKGNLISYRLNVRGIERIEEEGGDFE